jgi:hypothetical protein
MSWLMRLFSGDEEGHAVLDEEPARPPSVGALEHLDDRAFERVRGGPTPVTRASTDVAVQRLVHLLRPEEEVAIGLPVVPACRLGLEESDNHRGGRSPALDEPGLVGDEDRAAAVAHDLAFALHRGEAAREAIPAERSSIPSAWRASRSLERNAPLRESLRGSLAPPESRPRNR